MKFDELDLAIAKHLSANEEEALFMGTLSGALRVGKLYIEDSRDFTNPYIAKEGNRYYFKRAYNSLQEFRKALDSYLKADKKPLHGIGLEEAPLQPKQREACYLALSSKVTLIMGGPGTGKTYTAAHLVKAIEHENLKIALAAPTGKAATNLKSALSKVVSVGDPKTLHALLQLSTKSKTVKNPYHLEHDLFIVDEASMIDMDLMTALLRSMKPTSRLILLGDPNQLPPIDLGSPFSDMAEMKTVPAITLETCLRCESKEVLDLSQRILAGTIDSFFDEPKESVELLEIAPNPFRAQEEIIQLALNKYAPMLETKDPEVLFHLQKSFSILTPFRVGLLGSAAINQAIESHLEECAIPIMIRENRPDLGLFNGDLGFKVDGKGIFKERTFPELLLPAHEPAFCLSIHKSQGSEFKEALIIIPEGAETFGKKILYTALTRVKSQAIIYSNREILGAMAR